jgi:DNA-binding response OmpR family regulator
MNAPVDVLIVDDDPHLAKAIKRVLEGEGYCCECAADGIRALEVVEEAMPGLVLLDMPGGECARVLRETYGHDLAIVVVAGAEVCPEDVGADDMLTKPFELADLLRVVSTYVVAQPGVQRSV